jgi:hypothetical protein
MSRSVVGTVTLLAVAASSLADAVDHYTAVFTEAAGATQTVSLPIDGIAVAVTLDAGSWSATIVASDAAGNALTAPAVATVNGGQPGPLVVTDVVVVMVNVPSAMDLSVSA